jgi:hypothetical protein
MVEDHADHVLTRKFPTIGPPVAFEEPAFFQAVSLVAT